MIVLLTLINFKIPHTKEYLGNLKADVLKQAKGNIYQEHERFITTFDQKWRNDENIILILCAITLFTPDRARVVHQDVIKLEQVNYLRYIVYIYFYIKNFFVELVLLPFTSISGKRVSRVRSEIYFPKVDSKNLRITQNERRSDQLLFGRESIGCGTALARNFRFKTLSFGSNRSNQPDLQVIVQ